MATLAEIRAKLAEQENRKSNAAGGSGNNDSYPFWNIKDGSTATVRFLPDGDDNNTLFWVERQVIKIPFEYDGKEVDVQVPCMHMYGKKCPIMEEIKPWWNDEDLKPLARKYYKKRSYLFQGFVVNNPLEEDESDTPIRRFVINKSIFEIIKSSLLDAEMEESPVDFDAGRDFKITKTKKGQYADYTTSSWSMKVRSLSDEERAAIAEHGLHNLSEWLPNEPTEEQLEAIKEMFEASVNGEEYDFSRWGQLYRPFGIQTPEGTNTTTSAPPKPASAKVEESSKNETDNDDDTTPWSEDESSSEDNSPKKDSSSAVDALKARAKKTAEDEAPASEDDDAKSEDKPDPKAIINMLRERNNKNK